MKILPTLLFPVSITVALGKNSCRKTNNRKNLCHILVVKGLIILICIVFYPYANLKLKKQESPILERRMLINATKINYTEKENIIRYLGDQLLKFKYLISEPELCTNHPDLQIICYVHSAPSAKFARQNIRDTWGNKKYYPDLKMLVIFVMGLNGTEEVERNVFEENSIYHDIIQVDFMDSYRNLTIKALASLKWISEHCRHPPWILKTDDDVVVDIFQLKSFLKEYTDEMTKIGRKPNEIMGHLFPHNRVLRPHQICKKWCITKEEYKDDIYPPYVDGPAFLMPTRFAADLYREHYNVPFFWVDDVYITGNVAKQAHIMHMELNKLYTLKAKSQTKDKIFYDFRSKHDEVLKKWNTLASTGSFNNTLIFLDKYSIEPIEKIVPM